MGLYERQELALNQMREYNERYQHDRLRHELVQMRVREIARIERYRRLSLARLSTAAPEFRIAASTIRALQQNDVNDANLSSVTENDLRRFGLSLVQTIRLLQAIRERLW